MALGDFTKIPEDTFKGIQLDAGVLLKNFNPSAPTEDITKDIICATTGGVSPSCVATYSDMGEDIDNCPANMMELKHLDGWECKLGFTTLTMNLDVIKLALGSADIVGNKVAPRNELHQDDFTDIWWVGDRADGGMVAICLKNALSTGGFALQTAKNGKGQSAVELTGHYSLKNQKQVPMEFYSAEPKSVRSK